MEEKLDKLPVNNIIVNDGNKEYKTSEVLNNPKLYNLVLRSLFTGSYAHLYEEINKENGCVYLITDEYNETVKTELRNVSSQLYDRWIHGVD